MTLVVGLPLDGRDEPITLAAELARASGEDVVVVTVTPRGFPGARTDGEYRDWMAGQARTRQSAAVDALRRAGVDVVRSTAVEATSVPVGLVTAVEREHGSLLVVGSAVGSPTGRFRPGSVTEGLMHSSPVPLALAPRDCPTADRVARLTCAWVGSDESRAALSWTRRTAETWQVPVRLLTFAPERPPMLPPETGLRVEREIRSEWAVQARRELEAVAAGWTGPGPAPGTTVASGPGWEGAVRAGQWIPGDVLVVGSSRLGPLARVFLGSSATKIVRHSPVPVVLVPRGDPGRSTLDGPV